jgi:hypothetical protein
LHFLKSVLAHHARAEALIAREKGLATMTFGW